jgi:myosin-crossreactive antigen
LTLCGHNAFTWVISRSISGEKSSKEVHRNTFRFWSSTCTYQSNMNAKSKVYFIGGGIGSLSGAAFLIRDGGMPGRNITILEALPVMGGSLDAGGDPARGYSMRGGRMLTIDNYECTWDLFKSIPSLDHPESQSFEETVEFNEKHKSHSMARLVDRGARRCQLSRWASLCKTARNC